MVVAQDVPNDLYIVGAARGSPAAAALRTKVFAAIADAAEGR